MNREQKAATIDALAADIQASEAIFAVDYRGITVAQVAELRSKLRDGDATFKVVKNSLTERAADQVGTPALKDFLSGPTALTFVRGDLAMAAKVIADYARTTQLLPFKGGVMRGDLLDANQIRSISKLPSREVLYGQLVGVVASPISGLVRSLGGLIGGLAVALGQVQAKKESGEIPAGEAPAVEQAAADAPAGEQEKTAPAEADAPAAEEPAAQTPAPSEPQAEADAPAVQEPAAEATAEHETEPESDEPAQNDNQTEASADEQPETAEATKED
jgi:large subunit ribosomal protein L10